MLKGRETHDITFENVEVQKSAQSAFVVNVTGRGMHFKNCRVRPDIAKPGTFATRGGGIVIVGSEGDVVIEGTRSAAACADSPGEDCSIFKDLGDDGINFSGFTLAVTKSIHRVTANTIDVEFAQIPVRDGERTVEGALQRPHKLQNLVKMGDDGDGGDLLAFIVNGQTPAGYGRVKSFTYDDQKQKTVAKIIPAAGTSFRKLQAALTASDTMPLALNLTLSSSRSLVRNVFFKNGTGRGILVQTPNSMIRANRIEQFINSGIQARYSYNSRGFMEGVGANNVTIESNGIRQTTGAPSQSMWRGAISVGTEGIVEGKPWFPLSGRILLSKNRIINSRGVGIQLTATRAVKVVENTIINLNPVVSAQCSAPDFLHPRGFIYLDRAWKIDFSGNVCEGVACTPGQIVLGSNNGKVTGR